MNHDPQSCAVALPSKRNHATLAPNNATADATDGATQSLTALSERVLARNQRNTVRNFDATERLRNPTVIATHAMQHATHDDNKIITLANFIKTTGKALNASDSEIGEMLTDTLQHHDVDTALVTFRNLATQLQLPAPSNITRVNHSNVNCAACTQFRADTIGDGKGIGTCKVDAWRPNQPPLYPLAPRFCDQFKQKEEIKDHAK